MWYWLFLVATWASERYSISKLHWLWTGSCLILFNSLEMLHTLTTVSCCCFKLFCVGVTLACQNAFKDHWCVSDPWKSFNFDDDVGLNGLRGWADILGTKPTLILLVEVLLYVHRNHRFIRDGSPGRPPQLSHSSWTLTLIFFLSQRLSKEDLFNFKCW